MKKLVVFCILSFSVVMCMSAQQTAAAEITLTFTKQSGSASNQFAVWVEDSAGRYVKTLYVTKWTANGGFKRRETSIPLWVKISDLSNLTKTQIDAISGATPATGTLTYNWDGTDSFGAAVPAGDYVIVLEGTLRWENQAVYRAPIRLGSGQVQAQVSVEYKGDSDSERGMLSGVSVRTFR